MVAWFIIAIATLAIFAFIAVNGVQTVAATTDGVGRITTAQRLDSAAAALIARAGSPNGTGQYYVLAGELVNGVYGLPQELSSYATTAFGQRISYCPFGGNETGTASTVAVGSQSYNIQVAAANGRTYVVGGRPPFPQVAENPNLLGFLVAPRAKDAPPVNCAQVIYNPTTRRFEAPNGLVRPIIRAAGSEEARDAQARETVFYVSQTGTGRGLAANDPTSLAIALDYYRTRLPANMRIILANGSYIMQGGALNRASGAFANAGSQANLSIVNAAGQASIEQTGPSPINIPGNLYLAGLVFGQNTPLLVDGGNSATLVNTTIGRVLASGGSTISINGGGIINTPGEWSAIAQQGGSIAMTGNVRVNVQNGYGLLAYDGGSLTLNNATVNLLSSGGGSYGLYSDTGGILQMTTSTVNYNYPAPAQLVAYSRTSLQSSTLNSSAAGIPASVIIGRGAAVSLQQSLLGSGAAPQYGIVDEGAVSISGSGSVRAASSCWQPAATGLFAFSSNATSSVTDDEPAHTMAQEPTSADVATYAAVAARNQRRAALRASNTSAFTCNS